MIECVINGSLDENCYILYNDESDDCILIDPGSEAPLIDATLKEMKKTAKYVLITHGHFDHIGAAKFFQDRGARVFVHKDDAKRMEYDRVAVMLGCHNVEWLKADETLEDGQILNLLGYEIEVIHTPGHSKGGVCYIIDSEKCIFSGDTIFFRSYGRYDFPDGSQQELISSFRKIFALEGREDYIIYPGHGISTTLGDEKKYNMINGSL